MTKSAGTLLCIALIFLLCAGTLTAQKPYRGAELRTNDPVTYGRFEVRMKSAQAAGMLSSFFTYHEGGDPVAEWNEIDIEVMGRYFNEIQYNVISPGRVDHVKRQVVPFNPHGAFHVYAIEWAPGYVAWQVDGYEIYRQTGAHIDATNKAQQLMMNIWPPSYVDWAGVLDETKLPLFAYYDWIKYYEYTPGLGDNFSLQWEEDFSTFNSTRWSKATHTFDGNLCEFVTENCVFYNGYMVLCLTMPGLLGYNNRAVVDTDIDAPYVAMAWMYDDLARISFSEQVDPASAQTVSNYIIPGLTVNGATLLADGKTVEVTFSGRNPVNTYNLLVQGIKDVAATQHTMALRTYKIMNAAPLPLMVNAGGDAFGAFLADSTYASYQPYGTISGQNKTAAATVGCTDVPELYADYAEGLEGCRMRVPDGIYTLKLNFAETEFDAAGSRVFDVYVNGELKVDNLDIFAAAGKNCGHEIVLENLEPQGNLFTVMFVASVGKPVLSGYSLERTYADVKDQGQLIPQQYDLKVYPNPFNPSTKINYALAEAGDVVLKVYDLLGKEVENIFDGHQTAGEYTQEWNPADLSSGFYICRLQAGAVTLNEKMLYLK